MRVKFEGKDLGEYKGLPTLKESRAIKRELGMLPQQFAEAISEMDPDALSMLVAMMLSRGGTPTKWGDVDGEFEDFDVELTDEEKAAMGQETATGDGEVGKGTVSVPPAPSEDASPSSSETPPPTTTPPASGITSDSPS